MPEELLEELDDELELLLLELEDELLEELLLLELDDELLELATESVVTLTTAERALVLPAAS